MSKANTIRMVCVQTEGHFNADGTTYTRAQLQDPSDGTIYFYFTDVVSKGVVLGGHYDVTIVEAETPDLKS